MGSIQGVISNKHGVDYIGTNNEESESQLERINNKKFFGLFMN